jgi:hypothetical protein
MAAGLTEHIWRGGEIVALLNQPGILPESLAATGRTSVDGTGFLLQRGGGRLAFSIGGYAFTAVVLVEMARFYGWPGIDAHIWDRAGDLVRAGQSPYFYPIPTLGFRYAPPWAFLFAAVTWLPLPVVNIGINVLEVAALRYLAGSWLRVGWLCWVPLVPLELVGAQWNLVMAAAIAAAVRGAYRPAVAMATAKLSPLLAIEPRRWLRAILLLGGIILVTWPPMWLDWTRQLLADYGTNIAPGAQLLIPFLPRLVVAIGLVALRRPWARGLAAIVATPALYWVSGVLFFALLPPSGARRADSS